MGERAVDLLNMLMVNGFMAWRFMTCEENLENQELFILLQSFWNKIFKSLNDFTVDIAK